MSPRRRMCGESLLSADECLQAPQLVCASIILRRGLASAHGGELLKDSHINMLSLEMGDNISASSSSR